IQTYITFWVNVTYYYRWYCVCVVYFSCLYNEWSIFKIYIYIYIYIYFNWLCASLLLHEFITRKIELC
ncbi:MAG: hypothetical protein N7Q72_03975, partial [Spiroplasma sp. Tabriz.8]|nr:hypothetical protein [Spiroplasma sp. Tabriz.8]